MKQKRKAIRTYYTQEQLLTSPTSILPPKEIRKMTSSSNSDPTNVYNNQALLNLIHYANVMTLFKESIARFKGTNIPVMYNPNYRFSEKWEQANKVRYQHSNNVYLAGNNVCLALAVIVMVFKIPFIWFLSVNKIFELQTSIAWWNISLCFIIIDLLLKLYLVHLQYLKISQKSDHQLRFFTLSTIHNFIWDFMTILIIILRMVVKIQKIPEILIDVAVVIVQINRFNQIYNSLTILLISNKYKNQINLFGFISKLFTCLHIFAIVIYSTTLINSNHNWLQSINKDQADPITRYIYSIYFTGTTMFTVGYGDILPVNNLEIIVILIIQVVGIILIGYIVSQIGHTLSVMRQIRQDFEQDIQNADTVCDRYNLSEDLKRRVRNYVVNHRLANEELNTNQQQNFLMKLNEQLRNQVKYVNHLNIIKTSLFFICNWSKKMQNDLSKKLEKFIFSPNQPITRQDKLYIISRGKIDVFIQKRSGNKVYCKKHLKTLQRDPSKEVHANAYGYTSLFTNKPHNLSAISKDFAICYALDYTDILETIKDDQKDFENYHQIKVNLELQNYPQNYQMPDCINNRHHFCPSKSFVLKRYSKQLLKKQQRSMKCRKSKKGRLLCIPQKEEISDSDSEQFGSQQQGTIQKTYQSDLKQKSFNFQTREIVSKRQQSLDRKFISFRSYRRRFYSKMETQKKKEQELKRLIESQIVITSNFEVGKNYVKYFKKGNCKNILSQINKNSIKDFNQINSKFMSLQWIDLFIFGSKTHHNKLKQLSMKVQTE